MRTGKVCCVYTVYSLFLYIVNAKDEDIDTTLYILDTAIPDGYEQRLKKCWRYSPPDNLTGKWWIDWILFRWHIYKHLPRLHRRAELYMQDHKQWTAVYAGNHKYTYLEDSPQHIAYIWDSSQSNWYTDIMRWNRLRICQFLYGPTYYEAFAHHRNAECLMLTQDDKTPFLENRKRMISIPLSEESWNSFSEYKRERIMEIFDISTNDLEHFKSVDTMIITQPLWPDSVSQEEHVDIYKRLISLYDESKVIIKTHPRETIDYKIIFPKAKVFEKPLPVQILVMMGLNIKRAVTLYSTAVAQLPENITVDWYGTEFDDRLFKKVGHFSEPSGIIQIFTTK